MSREPVRGWLRAKRGHTPTSAVDGEVNAGAGGPGASVVAGGAGGEAMSPFALGRSTAGPHRLVGASLFELGDGPGRDQCWARLGESVTARVLETAGPVLGWSASPRPDAADRVQAVVAGRRALVVAEPNTRPGPRGPVPTHRISSYRLDEASLLHAGVAHTPAQVFLVAAERLRPPGVEVAGRGGAEPALPPELDAQTVRVVTSMPPRARQLLTLPMTATGDTVLRHHSFWQGPSPAALDVVFVVLASARRVTIATGARTIPDGADPSTAHWALDCWHGDVLAHRGR